MLTNIVVLVLYYPAGPAVISSWPESGAPVTTALCSKLPTT